MWASDDSATLDSRGVPRIFDWVALREVERYVASATEGPRKCARMVMPDHVVESRLSDGNLRTLSNLQQRDVVEVERIRREEYTGGPDWTVGSTPLKCGWRCSSIPPARNESRPMRYNPLRNAMALRRPTQVTNFPTTLSTGLRNLRMPSRDVGSAGIGFSSDSSAASNSAALCATAETECISRSNVNVSSRSLTSS